MSTSLRCPAFSINLGHQQPYVDDDVNIYNSAIRPSRPPHNYEAHRPTYAGGVNKPTSLYDPSYAIWNHDRPNDLAIGHDRPTYTTRPYHTVQMDYPQDEYDGGYPPAASGVHVPIEDSSSSVDYSRYRGNRMRMHADCCTECTMCVEHTEWDSSRPISFDKFRLQCANNFTLFTAKKLSSKIQITSLYNYKLYHFNIWLCFFFLYLQ